MTPCKPQPKFGWSGEITDIDPETSHPGYPVCVSLPIITGLPQYGNALMASSGTWSNQPQAFTYNWRVNGFSAGINPSYLIQAKDIGLPIVCVVGATNIVGVGCAHSLEVIPYG